MLQGEDRGQGLGPGGRGARRRRSRVTGRRWVPGGWAEGKGRHLVARMRVGQWRTGGGGRGSGSGQRRTRMGSWRRRRRVESGSGSRRVGGRGLGSGARAAEGRGLWSKRQRARGRAPEDEAGHLAARTEGGGQGPQGSQGEGEGLGLAKEGRSEGSSEAGGGRWAATARVWYARPPSRPLRQNAAWTSGAGTGVQGPSYRSHWGR